MLAVAIARYQPRTVISLGDSFHDAKASERLPSLYAIRLKSLMEHRDWFWITGNHDPDRPVDLPGIVSRNWRSDRSPSGMSRHARPGRARSQAIFILPRASSGAAGRCDAPVS